VFLQIEFKPFEYITRISGSRCITKRFYTVVGEKDPRNANLRVVGSLTIHTDRTSYGPYGKKGGKPFESDRGRIVGLFGARKNLLDRVGVFIIRSSEYTEGSEH
jgi:hypothetical protein